MKYVFCLVGTIFLTSAWAKPETIFVVPPYEIPPYIINYQQQKGIVFDLVKKLNQQHKNKFHFSVKLIPRARAIQMLEDNNEPVIISYISPKWIDENQRSNFLWSHVLFEDTNVIIYKSNAHIKKIQHINDLSGLRTSQVTGMKNQIYDELRKKIPLKIDTSLSIDSTFKKLDAGRIDFFITGMSIVNYYKTLNDYHDLSFQDHLLNKKFNRQLLIHPKNRIDILNAVNATITKDLN